MLPDVERVEMESELTNFSEQRSDVGSRQALAAIGNQTVPYKQNILLEFCGTGICGRSVNSVTSPLETVKHVREKATITFCLVVWSPRQMNAGDGALIMLQARQQFLGDARLALGRAQPIAEGLHVVQVLAQDQGAGCIQGIAGALWFDQGVAIAVSADP
jgi:hypothetical protein